MWNSRAGVKLEVCEKKRPGSLLTRGTAVQVKLKREAAITKKKK